MKSITKTRAGNAKEQIINLKAKVNNKTEIKS